MNLNDTLSLINESVRTLKAYHLGAEEVPVKLNQNENPYDWPAEIKEQIAEFCRRRPWNRYPAFIPDSLKASLGAYAGVGAENVIVGNGSNEMLLVLFLSFVKRDLPVIICQPTFTVYNLLATGFGARSVPVMLDKDLNFDIPGIVSTVTANKGGVLIICSPNNPTGSAISEQQLRTILDAHSGICILDQAYVEFGGFNGLSILKEYPNLIITRTFSKAFAGAGFRLGYMLGNESLIHEITKIKLPYNINFFTDGTAQVLLQNSAIIGKTVAEISSERDRMFAALEKVSFEKVYRSCANFILVRTPHKKAIFDHLRNDGILIRDVSSYPMLENCLRISIGTPDENNALLKSVGTFFQTL